MTDKTLYVPVLASPPPTEAVGDAIGCRHAVMVVKPCGCVSCLYCPGSRPGETRPGVPCLDGGHLDLAVAESGARLALAKMRS